MKCVICGCTDQLACVVQIDPEIVGCSWADENPLGNGPLCSQCVPEARELAAKLALVSVYGEFAEDLLALEKMGLIERGEGPEGIEYSPTELGHAVHYAEMIADAGERYESEHGREP